MQITTAVLVFVLYHPSPSPSSPLKPPPPSLVLAQLAYFMGVNSG